MRIPEKGLEASKKVSPWVLFTKKEKLTERLILNPSEWSGAEGSQFQISAVLLPGNNPIEALEWKSSDESVASVDANGLVSVLNPGDCIIIATTTDGTNVSAECLITSTSGVNSIFSDTESSCDVYDINGRLIKTKCDKESLKLLSSGIYIVRQGMTTRKIMVK